MAYKGQVLPRCGDSRPEDRSHFCTVLADWVAQGSSDISKVCHLVNSLYIPTVTLLNYSALQSESDFANQL